MPKEDEITYHTPEYPRQLRLDTTTICNAFCKSCHRFLTKRSGGLALDMIERILKDVSHWEQPLVEIVPVNYGEFFLCKDWYHILEMVNHSLPYTQITIPTNGTRLNPETIRKLCHIPTVRLLNFSINAYFEETYEAFMGIEASNLERIREAIRMVKALRSDIKIWASMVFDPAYQSDKERDLFVNYWRGKVDAVWVLSASSASRPAKVPIIHRSIPCRSIFSDIVIGFDGKLSSCCWDSGFVMDLGHYSGDLKADWHNPKLEGLRLLHNNHNRNRVLFCSKCTSA